MAFAISMVLGQGLVGCGTADLKAEGEPCFASSECDVGLTCDFGVDPPVCRTQQTGNPPPSPDAGGGFTPDAAGPAPDAAPGAPDAAPVPPDAAPVPPDAAPVPPDAAPVPPDAAPAPPDAAA